MSAVTLPCDPPISGVRGAAEIAFARRGDLTRLGSLFQHDPLRVLFPLPPQGEAMTAALVTTSGGLVGGDELSIKISAEAGTQALVTAQAAEKVYRSAGPDCRIDMALTAGADAWLELAAAGNHRFRGGTVPAAHHHRGRRGRARIGR